VAAHALDHSIAPGRWVPARGAGAVVICLRLGADNPSQFIGYANAAEAERADAELYAGGCGRGCRGCHVRVWCTEGAVHATAGRYDAPPVPAGLAAALRQAGYRIADNPQYWPAPRAFNEPLPPPRRPTPP
jgi:hypothetical protein